MKLRTTFTKILSVCFILTFTLTSCSKEEAPAPEPTDPREIFVGSYTGTNGKWCNEDKSYTSNISIGSITNTVIWTNVIGEDGDEDNVRATISGNDIIIPKQNIGKIEFEGKGVLTSTGNIEIETILVSGVATVFCTSVYTVD